MTVGVMIGAATWLALVGGAPELEEPVHAYAVIVANNQAFDRPLSPLRYADDDGARFAELLGLGTEQVEILSLLDAETQRVFPEVAARARPPTRADLEIALGETFELMRRDNEAGVRTIFYFVFVGHGSISESGEGYVHLLDGRFSRSDLFQSVIKKSPARINHVLIDACNAYFMVARRGEGGADAEAAFEGFLETEDLAQHPNTGVILSTSSAQEVHEWSRYEAGVFSHELRSALTGGADVDGDGRVGYAEARAFIGAANARIKDPKAKLRIYSSPPRVHLDEPLFDRARAPDAPTLRIPSSMAGRYYLQDERGVRYADLNTSRDYEVTLVLVPSPTYFLRTDTEELRIPLTTMRAADASLIPREPSTMAVRGSEALAFQRDLFAVPFGPAYYEGFVASAPIPSDSVVLRTARPQPARRGLRIAAWSSAAAAVAAAALGVGFGVSAGQKAEDYRNAVGSNEEVEAIGQRSRDHATVANAMYGTSAGLAVTSTLLFLFAEDVL